MPRAAFEGFKKPCSPVYDKQSIYGFKSLMRIHGLIKSFMLYLGSSRGIAAVNLEVGGFIREKYFRNLVKWYFLEIFTAVL